MNLIKVSVVLLVSLFSSVSFSAPTKSYHCEGKILSLDFTSIDRGRTYPNDPYTNQRTYDVKYKVELRKNGALVLQGASNTQAYMENDYVTWKYTAAHNPLGGDFDQPSESIWITTNDRDGQAVYYRNPYNNHRLDCVRTK